MSKLRFKNVPSYWAGAARPFMLGPVHGYVVVPMLLFIFHIRIWTGLLLLASVALSVIISRYGYTPRVLINLARTYFAGRHVSRFPKIGSRRIWR